MKHCVPRQKHAKKADQAQTGSSLPLDFVARICFIFSTKTNIQECDGERWLQRLRVPFSQCIQTPGVYTHSHTQHPPHTSQIHVYQPSRGSPHLSPTSPNRDSHGRNQQWEHTTLEVKPARRRVREREGAFNEFWPLFSAIAFTLLKQALYLRDQLKLTGSRQGVPGSQKADAAGCTSSVHVCLHCGTQPCAPVDMRLHTHKLRKARKRVYDLSDP